MLAERWRRPTSKFYHFAAPGRFSEICYRLAFVRRAQGPLFRGGGGGRGFFVYASVHR